MTMKCTRRQFLGGIGVFIGFELYLKRFSPPAPSPPVEGPDPRQVPTDGMVFGTDYGLIFAKEPARPEHKLYFPYVTR